MKKYEKIYMILGKVMLGIAGAIVGYVTAGVTFAIIGAFAGVLAGHFLENLIAHQRFTKT